jgi:hypothetical protein
MLEAKTLPTAKVVRFDSLRSGRYASGAGFTSPRRKFSSSLRIDNWLSQQTVTGASEKILSRGQSSALSSPGISAN